MKFLDLPKGEKESVEFLQNRGLLLFAKTCKNGHNMALCFTDGVYWQCKVRNCKHKIRMHVGTWFEGTRLPFETIICFFYSWAFELTSIKWCERELGIDHSTAVDHNSYVRQICHDVLWRTTGIIGGPGLTVEIDESAFTKRKYNRGRVFPTTWIFGGICRETKDVFLEILERRLAVIGRRIHLESTIISDSWKGYNGPEAKELTLAHLLVNHSKNFVDPESGAHTNTVERMWRSSKKRNKIQSGTARQHLVAYLEEFWWRNYIKDKAPFDELLVSISDLNKPKKSIE